MDSWTRNAYLFWITALNRVMPLFYQHALISGKTLPCVLQQNDLVQFMFSWSDFFIQLGCALVHCNYISRLLFMRWWIAFATFSLLFWCFRASPMPLDFRSSFLESLHYIYSLSFSVNVTNLVTYFVFLRG